MKVYGFDIDILSTSRRNNPYEIGSPEMTSAIYGTKYPILLPDCEESHEIAGQWFLDNIQLRPQIITDRITYDLSQYGQKINGEYVYLPPTLFIQLNEWELIADHNVFNHMLSLYFRPRPTWRKNPYASPINLSQ